MVWGREYDTAVAIQAGTETRFPKIIFEFGSLRQNSAIRVVSLPHLTAARYFQAGTQQSF